MHYNKVELCGVNTSKLKVLSDDEKKDLLKKAKAGDSEARQELINGNLRLVLSIIQRFNNRLRFLCPVCKSMELLEQRRILHIAYSLVILIANNAIGIEC